MEEKKIKASNSYKEKISILLKKNEDSELNINSQQENVLKLNNDIEIKENKYKEITNAISKEENALDKAYFSDEISKEDYIKENEKLTQKRQSNEIKSLTKDLLELKKKAFVISQNIAKENKAILKNKKKIAKLELKIAKLNNVEDFVDIKANKKNEIINIEKDITKVEKDIKAIESDILLTLSKPQRFARKFVSFFKGLPEVIEKLGISIYKLLIKFGLNFISFFKGLYFTFVNGDYKTKISYFIIGFGSFARGQWLRGLLFLVFEIIFILYMALFGGYYLAKLGSLGYYYEASTIAEDGTITYGANSFNIMLYGVLSIFFIIAFIYTWYLNIKQNRIAEEIIKDEKKLDSAKDDLRAMVDKNFHKTLLALPTLGIIIFTVLPIFFMILVAFTNYDANHNPPLNLFGWVGFDNFGQLFEWTNSGGASFSMTFGQILLWTLVWAFFATFTNYFLGMLVAMLINKKGIKLKKLWRTILVFSIAIPQFISILYVSQMFASDGIINNMHMWIQTNWFGNTGATPIPFWENEHLARITVIVINIWIGVPYLMLVVTGILMNIPADLYESANVDGASAWQQYSKITLPYMLFVTGPYLLTSFTGNMNNFNVIYLLTGGGPKDINMFGNAGKTDLLITWLFSLAINDSNYKLAAVIGIMVFIVVAVLSLIVYNLIPSTKNEEEFQ